MHTKTLITKNLKICFLIGAVVINLISGCAKAQRKTTAEQLTIANINVIIVYLSRTNNTKAVAEIIQKNVGGRLVALELEKPYPANYQTTVQQVVTENETGFLPPLKTKIDNIQQYEVVFVGFPTWGMKPLRRSDTPAHKKLFASI